MSPSFSLTIALKLTFFSVLMFAFGYAMVPLYEKICEATGINNLLNPTPQSERDFLVDKSRKIRTEFVTNARGKVAMTPNQDIIHIHPGQTYSVIYTLTNLSDEPLIGQAVPAYSPARLERWFKKVQCFCFDQLDMRPNEVRQAPVVFIVDPQIPDDISVLSLSYTFFQVEGRS